jgi:hypothetical protein
VSEFVDRIPQPLPTEEEEEEYIKLPPKPHASPVKEMIMSPLSAENGPENQFSAAETPILENRASLQ